MFYYDPVCGIKINRNKAYARLEYEDGTFYLCCPKCQSEFERDPEKYMDGMDQMNMAHKNYYTSEMAKFYDIITNSGYYDYKELVRVIKSILNSRRKILEVGIGTGNFAIPLAKQGFDIDGIDPSFPMLAIARGKAVREGVQIGLHQQDCSRLNLPFKYDAVLSHGGVPVYVRDREDLIFESYLPTLEENYEFLQKISHHLERSGLFIVNIQKDHDAQETLEIGDDLCYSSSVEYCGDFIRKTHYVKKTKEILMSQTFDIRRFNKKTIDDVLNQIGFRVLGEDKTGSFYVMQVK